MAACGGGGGPSTFEAYEARALDLAERIDTAGVVQPEDVPTTGTATYVGPVVFDVEGGALDQRIFAGEMTVDVDFQTNAVTGDAAGFTDDQNRIYTGQLDISSGSVVRTGLFDGAAVADLDGTLTHGETGAIEVDSVFAAAFAGANAEFMAGVVTGDVIVGGISTDFEGAAVLEEE